MKRAKESCAANRYPSPSPRPNPNPSPSPNPNSNTEQESYETEALRKQHELHDVEATLARLGEQNHNLTSCVGQVREQISGREAAMRTQLGLLKNATAFALYVDDAA